MIFSLDAVLTDTDGVPVLESTIKLVQKLLNAGVATVVYALRPGGQQRLKAAGVDDLFGVCVDGVPAVALFEATRRLPVTVDPRYHDAVIFSLDAALTDTDGVPVFESTVNLVRKLLDVGIATAVHSLHPGGQQLLKAAGIDDLFGVCVDGVPAAALVEATRRLGVRPQRSVVVDDAGAGVAAAHDGGFALVIGVDRTGPADRLLRCGADVVVADLEDVAVRTGDRRISELPDAVESYGQIVGVLGAREPVLFVDYDGTLSPIVTDPSAATLVDGAAKALESLASQCPVAILSGRDLADIRARVPIPGHLVRGQPRL